MAFNTYAVLLSRTLTHTLHSVIPCLVFQELFLEGLARRANAQMQYQHRSTLQYKDVGELLCKLVLLLLLELLAEMQTVCSYCHL